MRIPRIIFAGTNSGCGKTTITAGVMAALVKRGMKVQPFKVGPDYIDPMFHTFITGSASRNLDSWMLNEDTVKHLFHKNSSIADISIIEGVMGMFDGFGGDSIDGSTAHVAQIIKAPVVLIVNGEGMSLSIAALIKGYMSFDSNIPVKGVILNRIENNSHYLLLKEIIEEHTGLKVIGYLRPMKEYGLESRHLGLVPSQELDGLREKMDLLAEQVESTLDLNLLLKIAGDAQELNIPQTSLEADIYGENTKISGKVKIGVAWDKAFNFYYRDNLDLLEMLGAQIEFFSPLDDTYLPESICGLYFGGGYPEVFARELENNVYMREDIRTKILDGLPAYAECGGLMYMSESIETRDGEQYKMVGVIPGKSKMTARLQRFGYVEVEALSDSVLSRKGLKIRAHEFHYSVTDIDRPLECCWHVTKKRSRGKEFSWQCGYKVHNLVAGYPHLHFWGNMDAAKEFINSCIKMKERGDNGK